MNIMLYSTAKDGVGDRFQQEVEESVLEKSEIHRTIEILSRRLRQPTTERRIAVLLASNRKELLDLLSIRNLLSDIRIILILPDREEITIALGHGLHPRFISYIDSDFKDVGAVLRKMMGV